MKGNLLNIRYALSHNKEKTHSFLVERVCFLHYYLLIYPTKYSMGEKKTGVNLCTIVKRKSIYLPNSFKRFFLKDLMK